MQAKYRAYFFGNMYLSQIQQGIQALHVVSDMFIRNCDNGNALMEWARNDKTVILLNGGYQSNLKDIYYDLETLNEDLNLPVGYFTEEVDALNGAVTSVGIILPNYIYETIQGSIQDYFTYLSGYDVPDNLHSKCWAINQLIKNYKLA